MDSNAPTKHTWGSTALYYSMIEAGKNKDRVFERQALHKNHLHMMSRIVESQGKTPDKTLDRTMQDLRDAGIVDFVRGGVYRLIVDRGEALRLLTKMDEKRSSKGERFMANLLEKLGVKFEREVSFRDKRANGRLRFDFYFVINDHKYAVECDGRQHTYAVEHFGGIPSMIGCNIRDKIKNMHAVENDIRLIRVKNDLSPEEKQRKVLNHIAEDLYAAAEKKQHDLSEEEINAVNALLASLTL